jgi:hypothetical protein
MEIQDKILRMTQTQQSTGIDLQIQSLFVVS